MITIPGMAGFRGRSSSSILPWMSLGLLSLTGCRPRPVPVTERVAWRCVPVEFASINARAQEVVLFLPGDEEHSFRLVAPDVCRDLQAKAEPLAEVEFWVRGTAKAGVTAWHPELINGRNYQVLGGSAGAVPPKLEVDFGRVLRSRH